MKLKRNQAPRPEEALQYADCDNCPLKGEVEKNRWVPPKYCDGAPDLIIVAEAPGTQEADIGTPLVGMSGQELTKVLQRCGNPNVHKTNAVLCQPPYDIAPKEYKKAVACCRHRLYHELMSLDCRHVAALGAKALLSLTKHAKIFPWIGAPLEGTAWRKSNKSKIWYRKVDGEILDEETEIDLDSYVKRRVEQPLGELCNFKRFTIHPMLHPAFCMRTPAYWPVLRIHMDRAVRLASGDLKPYKWPKLHVEVGKPMLKALNKILKDKKPVGVDVETQGVSPLKNKLMCLGFATETTAVSIPWERYNQVDGIDDYGLLGEKIKAVAIKILKSKTEKVMQNGQHDVISIEARIGINLNGTYGFDTLLAHAITGPKLRHDLGFIACCEFHAPRWKTEFHVETDAKGLDVFVKRDPLELRRYNAKDALITVRLRKPLLKRLEERPETIIENVKRTNLMKTASRMHVWGVTVSKTRQKKHRTYLVRKKGEALKTIRLLAGNDELNPSSHAQLGNLFFTKWKMRPTKWSDTTGKPSLDESVLKNCIQGHNQKAAEGARYLLSFRRWQKLLSSYIDNLEVDSDHRCHPTWKVWGARTGRWSCTDPGLQTIPKPVFKMLISGKRSKKVLETPGLRDIFVPRKGNYLVKADYSQLELRIMAIVAGDQVLIDAYARGMDVHSLNTADIFGIPLSEVTKDRRAFAKMFVYAGNYGAAPEEIWRQMIIEFPNTPLLLIERLLNRWKKAHPAIAEWQKQQVRTCRRQGYVEAPISKRRQVYHDGRVDPNEVLNFPIQATGADIIDPAILAVDANLDWSHSGIIGQIHDEIITEGPKPLDLFDLLKDCMEKEVELCGERVRFPIDVSIGYTWADTTEVANKKEMRKWIKENCDGKQ